MSTHTHSNLTPTTLLTFDFNDAGQLWTARIAKGQRGAGQFVSLGQLGSIMRLALANYIMVYAAAQILANALNQANARPKVLQARHAALRTSEGRNRPLGAVGRTAERQAATVAQWRS